ncbi:hypothetical protein LY76DRAFT_283498 [Colletotrichum caudatum]|nr:hypothetical protein LY76DRAFT_283498 [Colletotrichum caudatum]
MSSTAICSTNVFWCLPWAWPSLSNGVAATDPAVSPQRGRTPRFLPQRCSHSGWILELRGSDDSFLTKNVTFNLEYCQCNLLSVISLKQSSTESGSRLSRATSTPRSLL